MTFDFSTLAFQDTAVLQLVHPATESPLFADEEEKLPITITVYGKTSKVYLKWVAESRRRSETRKGKLSDADEASDTATWLATITKSFSNLKLTDNKLSCFEDYKEFYMLPAYSWVGEQVVKTLRESDNFLSK
jgi:hypothetical protein